MDHVRKKARDVESRATSLLESIQRLLYTLPGRPGSSESAREWLEKFQAIAAQLHVLGEEMGGGSIASVLEHWVVHPIHPAPLANGQPSDIVPELLRSRLDLEQG